MKIKKLTELSILTAAALIVFIIELRFPNVIPIPGVKLGLANIFTVYAIYRFKPAETAMMVLVRVFLGSLFGGNISSGYIQFLRSLHVPVGNDSYKQNYSCKIYMAVQYFWSDLP